MITITTTPQAHNSIYRPIVFKCTSNVNSDSLMIQCEVYVAGQKVATLLGPEIDSEFEFDISRLIKSFLSFQYIDNIIGAYDCPEIAKDFYCVFIERYNNSIGIQSDGATVTSATYKANMINLDYYSFNFDDYIIGLPYTSKFLTNSPKTQKIKPQQKIHLYFITNESNVQINVEESYQDGSNNNFYYPVAITSGGAVFILGIITTDTTKIDVWIENTDDENLSEVRSFIVDNSNCKGYSIEWINNVNGLDNFIFTGSPTITSNTEKREAKKFLPSDYTADSHKTQITFTNTQKQISVFSPFVNEETANWLVELQNSKSVWQNDNGTRKAIKVVSSSIVSKNANNLMQVLLVFTYESFENY